MASCSKCGAPLPANSNICEYCESRNDVDLRVIHEYTTQAPAGERICPRCDIPLKTIDLKVDGTFLIERCETCMGLFFDPNELEALLEKSVENVFDINYKQINTVNKELSGRRREVQYIKCPVCRKLMNRMNFGTKSGVIVDRCKDHGVWLDSGELKHLLEWRKAGGALLSQQREQEKAREQRRKERQAYRKRMQEQAASGSAVHQYGGRIYRSSGTYHDRDIVDMLSDALFRLFR